MKMAKKKMAKWPSVSDFQGSSGESGGSDAIVRKCESAGDGIEMQGEPGRQQVIMRKRKRAKNKK